jgi:SAM-dependent methyltransferase
MNSPYQLLNKYYDADWGTWCLRYTGLLRAVCSARCPFPAEIIDFGCGTGVLAKFLSQEGHRVLGIDLSPEMISVASDKKIANASFVIADMSNYVTEKKFHCAISSFDAINYLTTGEKLRSFLLCVSRLLVPGGIFLFDCITDNFYRMYHFGTIHRNVNGIQFDQHRNYDHQSKIALTEISFPNGKREFHTQRAWEITDVYPVLKSYGFRILYNLDKLSSVFNYHENGRLVCIAQKK